ncbi:MAG: hypothetical protein PHH05_07145 [Syntrophaceticus sp.]|nr:hypothetical protein [Syntrophaceticus sp.]
MTLKTWQNILSILVIAGVGFVLFNVAFLLAAFVFNASIKIMGLPQDAAPPVVGRVAYLIIILLISWLVFRSKLNNLVKATYLTMPLMIVLIMLGISTYQQPAWLTAGIGAMIVRAVVYYIYNKRLSWLYYFATFYVALLALCVMIFRIEI